MKPLFSQKFAILTAENPRYGSVEGGNAALEQEMKTKGLKFTPMKGKYGTSENSYLVENPDHQDILSWGKKYGQDSVIVSDGGHHKMVYTNGPHEGLWHEGHSVSIHDKKPEDFYSTINLNNKPTHFTIDFDMDTKHGAPMKKSNNNDTKSSEPIKLYHITDKARFKLNPKFAPEDNSSAVHSRAGRIGIYLSPNPETWINNQGFNFASGYHRPFVVEFHADPSLLQDTEVGGRWGDEKFIPSHLFHKLSINRVIPTDAYIREKYGTVGKFEELSEKTFDTAEPLSSVIGPKPPWGWSYPFKGYKYPHDVRSLPDEEIKKLKENFYNTRKQIQKKEKARQRLNERLKSKQPKEKFNFEKSLKKSDSPKHLIHFSTTPGLTTLDPEFQGTAGRHSPETKHGKPTHPRVYFYEEGTPTESVVTGGAKSKYVVKHPGHDKIIDIANDLENQQQAKQQWLQKPIGSMQDAYFKLLKDKGYLGFKNSASGLPNVVAMFHATPVHAEIPMPKDMAANPDWTKAEVPMSLKKSDVKEAVEKIKGPAKVNEVLSEAKPDMRSKILAALRKEKLAKMNGSGTPGAGGATPPMMRPPVPAAPASMAMSKADESESRMAKKDLKDIMEYAQALDKMVVESEDLEDWVDSKITVARQYLSDIAHYLSYEHGQPTEELDKGDVISMKDKKVISTDTKAAPKTLVAKQPKQAVQMRQVTQAPQPSLGLAKSDSKKAKFERCVLAVKKKSGDKVNPWAVCHASVDGAKKSEDLEKTDMKVKEQEKPTKGMPQAKQLKADADLEKIKEGAENVAKAADKKKSELSKSGYFKEDKKTQLPKWHDPLKEQRESAAQEEQELRPESKMHIWAELERQKQMSQKPQKSKEELEKGKNVRKQREAVFGAWKTSAGSPRRKKQIAALTDMIKRRFGLEVQNAPGKVAASGKTIKKPNFHDNVVEHIGNPDSLAHEVGHLYQYGKDMESIDPRKEFKTKEQSLSDWQKDMDAHWGDLNVKHGYKKQAQTAEEYEPTALENYYRRRAGLPTHQKTASTEEKNRIESEKRGKKYKKPEIPRTHAVDDPSKEIVQKVKVKGKDGQEKEVWLTGSMKNLTDKTRKLVDQIDRGEVVLDPTRGFVEGTSVDAKINRRARAASKDKTRKDADTLMRSDEVLEKKLILGEGKPSKATKKATPEEHKAIMDKLSAALDTVKVDTSPEAAKERKMLLEHVKHKLKGQK